MVYLKKAAEVVVPPSGKQSPVRRPCEATYLLTMDVADLGHESDCSWPGISGNFPVHWPFHYVIVDVAYFITDHQILSLNGDSWIKRILGWSQCANRTPAHTGNGKWLPDLETGQSVK
jgi:hypothetical protein